MSGGGQEGQKRAASRFGSSRELMAIFTSPVPSRCQAHFRRPAKANLLSKSILMSVLAADTQAVAASHNKAPAATTIEDGLRRRHQGNLTIADPEGRSFARGRS